MRGRVVVRWFPGSSGLIARVGGIMTGGWANIFQAEFAAVHGFAGGGLLLVTGGWALAGFACVVGVFAKSMHPTIEHVGGFDDDVGCGARKGYSGQVSDGAGCKGRTSDGCCCCIGSVEPGSLSGEVFDADFVGMGKVLFKCVVWSRGSRRFHLLMYGAMTPDALRVLRRMSMAML